MATTRFSIETVFRALDKFSGPVARMTTGMDRFTRKVRKGMTGIGKVTKRMARGFRNAALSIGSIGVIGGFALKGLLGPAVAFQKAVLGINAVTRDRIRQEGKLNYIRERALRLGDRTIYTTTQVAGAMEELARAGLSTQGIYEAILPVLHAAGAEGSDIAETSKGLVGSLKAYGLDVNLANTTKAADVFSAVAADANTNVLALMEGGSKFLLVAKAMDFTFPASVAAIGVLQDRNIDAAQAGTALKVMGLRLAQGRSKIGKAFAGTDIDIWDKKRLGGFKSLPAVLAEVDRVLAKMKDPAKRLEAVGKAFGTRSVLAQLALSGDKNDPEKGFSKLLATANKEFYGPGGAAAEIYKLRQEGAAGAIRETGAAFEAFRVQVASGQLPNIEKLFDSMSEMLRKPENIEKWAGHLNDAVKNMKAWWAENKMIVETLTGSAAGGLKVVFKGIWAALVLIDAALRLILWPFVKLWDLASSLTPDASWVDDFNAWMGSFHPSQNQPQTYGAPYKRELYGEVIVKAEPGTSARIVSPRTAGGVPLSLLPNGDFAEVDEGMYGRHVY